MTHVLAEVDWELAFLHEIANVLDRDLNRLDKEIQGHPDPDSIGLLDDCENRAKLGFVACQLYISFVVGWGRARLPKRERPHQECLVRGPKHVNGLPIAQIVHAAGNYVKHHADGDIHKSTREVLAKSKFWRSEPSRAGEALDYPLANLLSQIVEPAPCRFAPLLALLEQWRDDLIAADLI